MQEPMYSAAVTPILKRALHTPQQSTASWPKIDSESTRTSSKNVQIVRINDIKHPAHDQRGLFAARHLPPDTFIIAYLGLIHTNADTDTDPHSNYDLSLDRELGLSIDATAAGNEARFINDYRGIADRANAEFRDCWVQMAAVGAERARWERRIGVFVLGAGRAGKRAAGIGVGQEVLVNYGRSFWSKRRQAMEDEGRVQEG